ncbi:major facilitator superfamily domain-containing protein [Talaromyces proteolyticus]|uniref:Major facilitator superfamily domain-containing protein n=1 Tax=Talaromyces proteolyticus TaxID=1131652 RepID=A0AAD4KFF2_9EURO|nr:major facilitator superfamily domain-containing protein [Talaromyces proteolyticus]KAH8689024.1 major facilitator superfamily domain-containing protein [Talaromyces proteolyticus]
MDDLNWKDETSLETVELPTPPDGGSRAWFHVFLCHMVFFNTWGVVNSYGVFQQYYTQTLGHAPSDIGWIGGVQMFLLFGAGVFSGRASDAGYFRHCFIAGVVLQVLGVCLTSLCTRYYQIFLSQAVCVGIGNGLVFTPGLSVMSSYFHNKRLVAVGLSAAGAATGGMVYPATVNALLYHSNVGYPWTMRVLGLIMLVTHIPSIVGYRPYLPPRITGPIVEWQAFREKPFVFFTASMFFNFWGLYMAFFYLGIFARETIHLADSLNLLIVLNGVGVIGRTVPNFIGQKYTGIMNITIVMSLISAVCIYCWAALHDSAGLYGWTVIYGLVAGGAQALFPAMATRQTTELNKVGTRTGMVLSIVSFSCLTAPAIQGALCERDGGGYLAAQLFSASSVVVGAGFLVLSRWSRVGLKLRVKI